MINLLELDIDINNACKLHFEYFSCYVTKRLTGNQCKNSCSEFCIDVPNRQENLKSKHFKDLVDYILSNNILSKILTDEPENLFELNNKFEEFVDNLYGKNQYHRYLFDLSNNEKVGEGDLHRFFNDIKSIFNYSWLTGLPSEGDYSAYTLTENLGVRSCTYCNRAYTITRTTSKKGKLMRPQLDHWFPKSKFPLLAISFYNLIPSCYHCNGSVKSDVVLNFKDHTHPYIKEVKYDDVTFDYFHYEGLDKYRIFLKKPYIASGKSLITMKKLKVDEMYNGHHDELKDLIKIKSAYSDVYIQKMQQLFPDSGLTESEIYRLLFGAELDKKAFHKRPFSKFKYDILKELGIIK